MTTKNYTSSHSVNIFKKLNDERKTRKWYCDVTLKAGSTDFPAHKCVLGACSTFFDSTFNSEILKKSENEVNLKGVDEETFEAVLDFMYTCDITITSENVYKLLEVSTCMEIPKIKRFCEDFLLDEVNASNCLSIREYSKLYYLNLLLAKANNTIARCFDVISNEVEFKEWKLKEILDILQIEEKEVWSAEIVFNAIIGWIKHDVNARQQHLVKLFGLVKLNELCLDFLLNVVSKEKLIMNSLECTKMCFQSAVSRCRLEPPSPTAVVRQDAARRSPKPSSTSAVASQSTGAIFMAFLKNGFVNYNVEANHSLKLLDMFHYEFLTAICHNFNLYIFGIENFKFFLRELSIDCRYWDFPLPLPKCVCSGINQCVVFNNHLYVGHNFIAFRKMALACYSIAENTWSETNPLMATRSGYAVVSSQDGIYALGGITSNHITDAVEHLNPQDGRWENVSSMNEPRKNLAAVCLNDQLYAIGGVNGCGPLRTVERYDPVSKTWLNVASMNEQRRYTKACVVNCRIYVSGEGSDALEVYDPKKDVWEIIANNPDWSRVICMTSR